MCEKTKIDGKEAEDGPFKKNIIRYQVVNHSMMIAGLVSGVPDVGEGNGRVESIEDAKRKGHVLDDCPQLSAVELLLGIAVAVRLGLQRVPDVEGKVGHEQESHNVTS